MFQCEMAISLLERERERMWFVVFLVFQLKLKNLVEDKTASRFLRENYCMF